MYRKFALCVQMLFFAANAGAVPLTAGPGDGVCDANGCYRIGDLVLPGPLAPADLTGDWTIAPYGPPDRYERHAAWIGDASGGSLQERLLAGGRALIDGRTPDFRLPALLRAENDARRAGLGLWRVPPVWSIDNAPSARFGFLEARLIRLETRRGHRILVLGNGEKEEASGFIPAAFVPKFDGPALERLVGQRLRLRGWIERRAVAGRDQPSVALFAPYAIEPAQGR